VPSTVFTSFRVDTVLHVLIDCVSLGVHRATVTATASTTEKLDWLRSIPNGATHTVNYTTEDFAAEVKKTTNGKGVDVVVDFVGQSHWSRNIESLAVDGRMTILATLSGGHSLFLEVQNSVVKPFRKGARSPQSTLARYFTSVSESRGPRCVHVVWSTRPSSSQGIV
jgi:NADPH:quinone reductase-like Zn-dependent oxidoreductase